MVSCGFWILVVLLFSNLVIESYVLKPHLMISSDWNLAPYFLFDGFKWLKPKFYF
jgi:hypothetical protein